MIRAYLPANGRLEAAEPADAARAIWFDLESPDQTELDAVSQALGVDMPSRADMEEIEISSRLYIENGVTFLTATLPEGTETADPRLAPVTFVLAPDRVVTVRHHDPLPFTTFPQRAQQAPAPCVTPQGVLIGLLDAVTDRLADVLERIAREIDALARTIFRRSERPQDKTANFQQTLERIGQQGDLVSKVRESLATLERLFGFLGQLTLQSKADRDIRAAVKMLARDTQSLVQYAEFLSQKITLLLDATLGMISIEQSAIIKIFSVVAVVFLPPTLIASIYGMNFNTMPELDWIHGYPFALVLMVISAILPYVLFKRRGWL
jgi:magnesium transporter